MTTFKSLLKMVLGYLALVPWCHAQTINWGGACTETSIVQRYADCLEQEDWQACLGHDSARVVPYFLDATAAPANHDTLYRSGNVNVVDVSINAALIESIENTLADCEHPVNGGGQIEHLLTTNEALITPLGNIPAGRAQVKVFINAAIDVDLQLFDGSTALIDRQTGLLNGASPESMDYHGMRITYSGHAGDDDSGGNEFLLISGITPDRLRLQLVSNQVGTVTISHQWGIDPSLGAIEVPDRETFNALSDRSETTGATGIRELKFLVKDITTDYPSLYFMNSNNVPLHLDFVYEVLNWYPSLSYSEAIRSFNSSTYFFDDRKHLAGSVLAHDNFINDETGTNGLHTLQMWPTDPVAPELTIKAHQLLLEHMNLGESELVYYPASDTHTRILQENQDLFNANQVGTIDSETLFANVSYTAMNLGEGYGTLRVVRAGDPTPSVNDVVVFTFIPNDLAHVAGIITDTPQTPLSHINLIAKQNNTPNAFIKDAATNPDIEPLIGQLVHYQVTHDGFILAPATQSEADAWLASVRPAEAQTPMSDLSVTEPARLDTLRHQDWIRFGAKAANVAELAYVLEPGTYPVGYAIPFAVYDEFMQLNRCQGLEADGVTLDGKYRQLCDDPNDPTGLSLYQQIQAIMAEPDFINSPDVRAEMLGDFRKDVRKAEVPMAMTELLESVRYFWDPDGNFSHSIRLRSSTNNEDLVGFNGAGLYDSNTHNLDEGKLAESVKKVWASLWTARAFEERRFYRIDHFESYMGVLAHLNYGDEQVNGVAVTKNIYDRNWEGYYVNAQYGEISVTNPEPITTSAGEVSSIPDEFLLARLLSSLTDYEWVQQYIRRSNVETVYGDPIPTANVLTDDEVLELRVAMQRIQNHFKLIYGGDENFAMDIEFKITATDDGSRGHLEIKQARPWVD